MSSRPPTRTLQQCARENDEDGVDMLLNDGAGSVRDRGQALILAAKNANMDIVSMLLEKGVDINWMEDEPRVDTKDDEFRQTALMAAIESGQSDKMVSFMLKEGANPNIVASWGATPTALSLAVFKENRKAVSLLLEFKADVNLVHPGDHGTALGVAVHFSKGDFRLVTHLLNEGANINAISGKFGTALGVAVDNQDEDMITLLLSRGADVNIVGGNYDTVLGIAVYRSDKSIISLLLERGADINLCGSKCATALGMAIIWEEEEIANLLLDRGADINLIASSAYGSPLQAAIDVGGKGMAKLLLSRGADVNLVASRYGSALGQAVWNEDIEIVSSLLEYGSDVLHVGGGYGTNLGEYPTALDVAEWTSVKDRNLLNMLHNATQRQKSQNPMNDRSKSTSAYPLGAPWPPFPMPVPINKPSKSESDHRQSEVRAIHAEELSNAQFKTRASITTEQADVLCHELDYEVLTSLLTTLVGVHEDAVKKLSTWIQNDIEYFVKHGFDFGLAYAAARAGWKHFNEWSDTMISMHRYKWLRYAMHLDSRRINATQTSGTSGEEHIVLPYSVMPRRVWDLKGNRVIDFQMLYSEEQARNFPTFNPALESKRMRCPAFWAISHSWTSDMESTNTSINGNEWSVPMPRGVSVESIRNQLLDFGADYAWLDVLCLRQYSPIPTLDQIRKEEWKIDVPTIGNVYRAAEHLVRYFNGLGIEFSQLNWDSERHWLRRAWTLQEIKTENTTFNGSVSRINILNTRGKVGGKETTLRRAIRPVLRLAGEVDSENGCTVYDLAREMDKRYSTQDTDQVAGLFYLLRTTHLPTYNANITAEDSWRGCCHLLPLGRRIELLFDFPYRGSEKRWLPTWKQLLKWPDRDLELDHARPELSIESQTSQTDQLIPDNKDPEITLVCGVWILPNVLLEQIDEFEYEIKIDKKTYGFYAPYLKQLPIEIKNPDQRYTFAVLNLGQSYNWAVCEPVEKKDSMYDSALLEIIVLRKIGVLRTDSCSELLVGGMLKQVNVVFE